jgi:serine palmitoyltransferase
MHSPARSCSLIKATINRNKGTMDESTVPFFTTVTTYLSYFIIIVLGHARDFVGRRLFPEEYEHLFPQKNRPPLFTASGSFYTRRLYGRIKDCWNRPITGTPGRMVTVLLRKNEGGELVLTGEKKECLNLSSYNYLGYAGKFNEQVIETLVEREITRSSPPMYSPKCSLLKALEDEVSAFLSKEATVIFPMGFATNACTIPYIVERGDLILSDSLNHASIFFGTRVSPCNVKIFKHNNVDELERLLIKNISQGQDITHRSLGRILVLVEGIYSMEGEVVNLKALVELKKKYKFYLFVDEAHSIGAMGKTGRGVCEYLGVDFREVDILMGTFTKSFGAAGGYISGSRALISRISLRSELISRGEQIPPGVIRQILESFRQTRTKEGVRNVRKLAESSRYFREKLKSLGFVVLGETESPVVPLLLYNPGKIAEFSRLCLIEGVAVVVVGYPATPVVSSRVRFCLSAAHTRQDLDRVINVVSNIGDLLGLKMHSSK